MVEVFFLRFAVGVLVFHFNLIFWFVIIDIQQNDMF
jgi:hypothetical protein